MPFERLSVSPMFGGGRATQKQAPLGEHDIAHTISRMVRDQDFRDGSAKHHLADGGGASVGLCLVHASTNVRFEREKLCPQQQLFVTGLGNRPGLKSEIAFLGLADRASCQYPLACAPVTHLIVSPVLILLYGNPRRVAWHQSQLSLCDQRFARAGRGSSICCRTYGCRHLNETSYSPLFRTSPDDSREAKRTLVRPSYVACTRTSAHSRIEA